MFSLSFRGKIAQRPYALWSCAIFLSQHLLILVAFKLLDQPLRVDWRFALVPLRAVLALTQMSSFILIVALAYLLAVAWALAVLAFRRAADANIPEWIAVFVIPPIVQVPAMIALAALPSRTASEPTPVGEAAARNIVWSAAVQGMLAGMALTLASVAVGALFFGAYGYGMFIVSPFVVGATAGYLANRNGDVGILRTEQVAAAATALGGAALVVAALEGIVCIVMASPLVLAVALMGGMFGRDIAVSSRRSARQTLLSVTLLPLVFTVDTVTSATTFDTTETIFVDAPAPVVWNAIIRMDALNEPLALPFRLGVAYPLSGTIVGEGVGATRFGEFSTGTAVERITEWVPDRKLVFTVLKDVPAMHELSPYSEVHAPHVRGYFTTLSTSFELIPLTDGRTEILEHTSHALRLDPIFYWLPFARWIVHENNARVLAHIRYQSERAARADWR